MISHTQCTCMAVSLREGEDVEDAFSECFLTDSALKWCFVIVNTEMTGKMCLLRE